MCPNRIGFYLCTLEVGHDGLCSMLKMEEEPQDGVKHDR